ncbi:formate nitrite transporter family protein [Stemphylium lycopersici]|nr:formate nitrite transporter family protein [Stemphylium lycopersici]
MAVKREYSPSPPIPPSDVYFSAPIQEQTSTFKAAFSPTLSAKALQALPEFRTATHKIAAWRKPSRQKSLMPESRTLYDLGHDDDGEKWAGGRLSNVLRDISTEGVVVVARWYGGQNIGPIRFTHMETCAKAAIYKYKVAETEAKKEQASKKQKVDEEAKRKELTKNLQERDYSIFALRKLLDEKKAKVQGEEAEPPTRPKLQDYGKMGMDALLRVDKARDATIAFILKQIDKADEELKLVDSLDGGDVVEACKEAEQQVVGEKDGRTRRK